MSLSLQDGKSARSITMTINEDNLVSRVITGSSLLLTILAAVGFTIFSSADGWGIVAGGSIAILNFIWQRHALQMLLTHCPNRPVLYSTLRFVTRLAVVALALFLLIKSGYVTIAGLLTGLSVIVVIIIACTVYFAVHHKGA